MGDKRPPLAATDKRRQAGHKRPPAAGEGPKRSAKDRPKRTKIGEAKSTAGEKQKKAGKAKPLAHLFHDRRTAEKQYRTKNLNATGRRAF